MSKFMDKLKHVMGVETKHSQVAELIAASSLGRPVWTPRNYKKLAEEGYQKNPIVFRAINLISRGASGVRWNLLEDGHVMEEHPLLNLIRVPNQSQALAKFIETLVGHLLLSGNVYVEAVFDDLSGQPIELHLLRPDRVKVVPGKYGTPAAYEYEVENGKRRIEVDPMGTNNKILHIKTFNPINDWYGMSPIEAAAIAIDQHNEVSNHNLSLLQNGARPSGVFQIKSGPLHQEQREKLRQQLLENYQSSVNAGRPLVIEGQVEWKEMGLSPKDLDFINGKFMSSREIAQAFGVPAMLVGVPGDATFSNYREARYHLWEDTILPIMESIKTEFNRWLVPFFEEGNTGLRLTYDTESIAALTPKRESAWAKIAEADFLTINEKRAAIGYPPIDDGDRLSSVDSCPDK